MRRASMADEAPPLPPPECFICTESAPPPRRSACKCTDRHVHDACLARMLETSLHAGCPVCATPYANVSCQSKVVGVDAFSPGGLVLASLIMGPALLMGAVFAWQIYYHHLYRLSEREEFFVHFSAMVMGISSLAILAFAGRECVVVGPRALSRSVVVRSRIVRVQK